MKHVSISIVKVLPLYNTSVSIDSILGRLVDMARRITVQLDVRPSRLISCVLLSFSVLNINVTQHVDGHHQP
jgi:hypothetical protein